MPNDPIYSTAGSETEKIDVRLSYGIVRLFSEGLYASPNKAVEELVANSFDAGALKVAVLLPADFHEQGAAIAVVDDGEGMDSAGLKTHWLIGKSLKRALQDRPRGRQQIGKFGIGKLATYVLANRLTHISKKNGKYYSTSMNFKDVDARGEEEVEAKSPIRIVLRELTEEQAKQALKPWTDTTTFQNSGFKLFGSGASKSWTFAILSDLKLKVHQIERGRLEWVLRTALPLRDDFQIYYNGKRLEPSKAGKGRLKKWILGSDIVDLPKPAENQTTAAEDENEPEASAKRHGLTHPLLGRITGYAEAYKDLLTGKSDDVFRSFGFFVYVRDRLINVEDGHFGISPDELRHGTFGRIRVVVYMDGLDDFLQSDRERIREGPVRVAAQNILRAIFNHVRQFLNKHDAGEDAGARLGSTLGSTPGSVSRRPIIEMVRASLAGSVSSSYLIVPPAGTQAERNELIAQLEERAETPELFVSGSEVVFDVAPDRGIAMYDVTTSVLRINGFHPFVAGFYDDFSNTASGLPLELFAMAEVLLESQLFQAGHAQADIDAIMAGRDQFLRDAASRTGSRTALAVANALRNARNDKHQLEVELVAAFDKLGFKASQPGRKSAKDPGKDKPDGLAVAVLGVDGQGNSLRYSVTLEAKSTVRDGKRVPAGDVGISVVALHRDKFKAEHALVVAPSFTTTKGIDASVAQQIAADGHTTAAAGKPRTITLINIDDLSRLVRIAPTKKLGLTALRELFRTCSLPEESKAWVDKLEAFQPKRPPYKEVIETIYELQRDHHGNAVEYYGLKVALGYRTPPISLSAQELMDLCRGMSQMAPGYMSASEKAVAIEQSPVNVLAAVETATKAHLADKH
jgi:hypothetical protein